MFKIQTNPQGREGYVGHADELAFNLKKNIFILQYSKGDNHIGF